MNQIENILNQSIGWFIIILVLAFFVSFFWKNKQENPVAYIVLFTKAFYVAATVIYAVLWFVNGQIPVEQRLVTLYQTDHFVFAIQFYYDLITAVFSIVGAVLFFLVSTFSRYYMHRDEGYKRFFNTILFFAVGYNLIIFSGNFETLFIGWEIIGLSSFLLILFYRSRYLPVKNAFKTISNYRLSDVALILVMWLVHHMMHQNIGFTQLAEAKNVASQNGYSTAAFFIVILIVLAAMIKSAQVPFTSWLPRAMEGPTASSAIFYGSLSVHIGVFLLLRTWPLWQDMLWAEILVVIVGGLTAIIASLIGRVQATVKTQIAYSSAAQIGIIFIEIALGWHVLALIHFAGNAFLRTYQLLVSPSVLNYLVHHQYFHYHPPQARPVSKIQAALYVMSVKEWNLDTVTYTYLWRPFKWIGKKVQFLRSPVAGGLVTAAAFVTLLIYIMQPPTSEFNSAIVSGVLFAIALSVILFSFSYRGSALKAWWYLLLSHLLMIVGILISAQHVSSVEIIFYGSGIGIAFLLGLFCLSKIQSIDNDIVLNNYHGYVYEQKNVAFFFLLAAIGILGFPITAAFIGIDVLFTYIGNNQPLLIGLLALCMIFIELAAIRIFIRIFLGPHKKLNHPVAFRSS